MRPGGYRIEPDINAGVARLGCIGHQRNLMGARFYAYAVLEHTRLSQLPPHVSGPLWFLKLLGSWQMG